MKRMILMSLLSFNLMTGPVHAQPTERTTPQDIQKAHQTNDPVPGKNRSNNAVIPVQVSTVAVAKTLKDNTQVRLQGQVVRALGKDKYEFRDSTGTLIAEIDQQKWHSIPITQQSEVILVGEIERESDNTIKLEVDEVRTLPDRQ